MKMEPYYDEDGQTIYHGKAEVVMPQFPDDAFDLLATDPPFLNLIGGYSFHDGGGVSGRVEESISVGDEWGANLDWVEPAKRIAKLGAMVFCTYHGLIETGLALDPWRRVMLLSWHKRNAPATGANVPRFTEEYIWCFAKRPGLRWDAFKSTLIDVPKLATGCMASAERVVDAENRAIHKAQKPIAVMQRLLAVGPTSVIDPFLGTGTTLVAAKMAGCRGVGIEVNESYCEIAANRLRQGVLFGSEVA